MNLGSQIRLFVLLTAVVPLLVLALMASRVAREELTAALTREQVATAAQLAASVGRVLDEREAVLAAQLGNFQLDVAPDEARTAFLISTWRLFPEASIVALLDAAGEEAVPPIHATTAAEAQGHEVVDAARLASFRGRVPSPSGAVTRGDAYLPEGSSAAALPVALRSPRGDGMVLAAELSLAPLRAQLEQVAGTDRAALLVDPAGNVLLVAGRSPLVDPERLRPLLASVAADARVDDEVVVATTRLPERELVAVVAAPAADADAVLARVLRPTWYVGVVSLLAALAAGTLLGRSITDPVLRLREAAQNVGEGDLARRVPVEGGTELSDLSRSFNQMTERLEANNREIAAKNEEIEAFNRELQDRVDQRTRELREAQARLVQTSQVAAVAEMSAGLAHELNNPLAGILGIVQVVRAQRAEAPESALLAAAEAEAQRCREIVAQLLRFTAPPRGSTGREWVELGPLMTDVCSLAASSFRQRGVNLEFDAGSRPVRLHAPPDELGRALSQVVGSLRNAAAPGGTLRVRMRVDEPPRRLELRFELDLPHDNQDDWRAAQVGLWAARRVLVEEGWTVEEVPVDVGRAWHAVCALPEAA